MPVCPADHDLVTEGYCDTCGLRVGGPAPNGSAPSSVEEGGTESAAESEPACPRCSGTSSGRFCEDCGFDLVAGSASADQEMSPSAAPAAGARAWPGPAPASGWPPTGGPIPATRWTSGGPATTSGPSWAAVVSADRAYYDRLVAFGGSDAVTVAFPSYYPERLFRLGFSVVGAEKQIGRRSTSRRMAPAIDLTGPPTDPGISHLHAVLIGQPDGGWAVIDPGSENGILVNYNEIAVGVPITLREGDRIHLGAWTVITVRLA